MKMVEKRNFLLLSQNNSKLFFSVHGSFLAVQCENSSNPWHIPQTLQVMPYIYSYGVFNVDVCLNSINTKTVCANQNKEIITSLSLSSSVFTRIDFLIGKQCSTMSYALARVHIRKCVHVATIVAVVFVCVHVISLNPSNLLRFSRILIKKC